MLHFTLLLELYNIIVIFYKIFVNKHANVIAIIEEIRNYTNIYDCLETEIVVRASAFVTFEKLLSFLKR